MKLCFVLLVPCFLACAIAAQGAEPPKESERDQQQIVALTKEVQSQQTAIAENQTKINEKLAAVAEAIRQAKIYAGRGR
jgi:cytochrome c-type biogenesis protein CcmH/NrfF